MERKALFFSIALLLLISGCAGPRFKLRDWSELPKAHYTIPPYARYLAPFKIALDPGHGGMADLPGYKRGPTGKREAIMNLNVAKFLKEFLENAGATVVLTRDADAYVSLAERVETAERAGCDFLISLHHNASSNPQTNFAAVFYHMRPDSSPVSMDLARNIYFGLVDALHLPQVSDEGLLSDQYIYPGGFGLLRHAHIPAVLLESSFFSNPNEEERLMDQTYNRREAYGIFLGLAKWAASGIPKAELLQPRGITREKKPHIVYALRDGITDRANRADRPLLVYSRSIALKIDGKDMPVEIDWPRRRMLCMPPDSLKNGAHFLQAELANLYKNHNFPRTDTLVIAAPTDSIHFTLPQDSLPADGFALMPINLRLFDATGDPVWDGTKIRIFADRGMVAPQQTTLRNGQAIVLYRAPQAPGLAQITVSADGFSRTRVLRLVPAGQGHILAGVVTDDSTRENLEQVNIRLDDIPAARTDYRGSFFLGNVAPGLHVLSFEKPGYFREQRTVQVTAAQSLLLNIPLKAVFGGALHQQTIILDAALGGYAQGDRFGDDWTAAQANLQLAKILAARLQWAGAQPILVRDRDRGIPSSSRIEAVNSISEGIYLKLSYRHHASDSLLVQSTIYPASDKSARLAAAIHEAFGRFPETRCTLLQNTRVPEVTLTNKTAIEVQITCWEPKIQGRDFPAILAGLVQFYKNEHLIEQRKRLSAK